MNSCPLSRTSFKEGVSDYPVCDEPGCNERAEHYFFMGRQWCANPRHQYDTIILQVEGPIKVTPDGR